MAYYGKGKEDVYVLEGGREGVVSHSFGLERRLKGSQGSESWSSKEKQ